LTGRIFAKLILAVVIILAVALVAVDALVSRVVSATYRDALREDLIEKGHVLAAIPRADLEANFQGFARQANARLTRVAKDGRVLADSGNDAHRMANHADRAEIIAAFAGRDGWSMHRSATMGLDFLYVAVPAQGEALRLAIPLARLNGQVNAIRGRALASAALAFVPLALVAALFARYYSWRLDKIIEYAGKLSQGDFKARLNLAGKDELGELGRKLQDTGEKLQRMFEQLEREHAELEKLERVRKDFVINVSHELRTPLASIQGYTETLLDGAIHDEENNVRFLAIIRQNTDRLRRLTEDLLTLSRIELNRHRFQTALYDVNALLAEQVDAIRPMAEKKNIRLSLEAAPAGTEAFCDSEAVHQIVTNLLDNALKYTPEGGSVTLGAQQVPGMRVLIYVRDSGIGIPEEDLPRLFERFYRVDKARSRQLGGTGLGLAIVKHLVRAQGGEAGVESVPNQGSTFYFTLPQDETGLPAESPPAESASSAISQR
jgi:two-component system phosphate regulon sensor histidine kinase PhoR